MNQPLPAPDESPPDAQILIYHDGATQLQVRLDGTTAWLPQRLIAELFQVSVPTVNEHLANIYGDGELDTESTIRKFLIVQTEGNCQVRRAIDHYNLDAILAVGYRVRYVRCPLAFSSSLSIVNYPLSIDDARRRLIFSAGGWGRGFASPIRIKLSENPIM